LRVSARGAIIQNANTVLSKENLRVCEATTKNATKNRNLFFGVAELTQHLSFVSLRKTNILDNCAGCAVQPSPAGASDTQRNHSHPQGQPGKQYAVPGAGSYKEGGNYTKFLFCLGYAHTKLGEKFCRARAGV
jgi:hypothetical protein